MITVERSLDNKRKKPKLEDPFILSIHHQKERGTRLYFNIADLKVIKEKFGEDFFLFNSDKIMAHIDPVNETIYLSSVYKRKIVSICRKGTVKDFISDSQDGIWAVLGMEVDPKRRVLWVCNSSSNQMKNFKPDDSGRAAIHKYDLTGKLIKKYTASENESHEFNDLVVNSDGDVYITDSHTGEIFFIHHQRDTLELLFEEGLFDRFDDLPVRCGMVCAAIGAIPYGPSFAETPEDKKKEAAAKVNMLKVGADALVKLVYGLI